MSKRGKGAMLLLARLDSSRLPEKQLKKVSSEETVLSLLVKRLRNSKLDIPMVLTTSNRSIDDPLVKFAEQNNLEVFRGNVDNVAGRCLDAMKANDLDWFIRICADSPLMDPEIVDQVADEFLSNDSDLTSNVFITHDFPYGCSVEIVTRDAMQRICDLSDDPYYLEHVTAYAYEHRNQFQIHGVHAKETYSDEVQSITVDTLDDYHKAIYMVKHLDDPVNAKLSDIVPLAEAWQKQNSEPKKGQLEDGFQQ